MAKLRLKPGVDLRGVRVEMCVALMVVDEVFSHYVGEVVVTSCVDGKHKKGSLHYKGLALDIRTKNITGTGGTKERIRDEIQDCLGAQFDVILEGLGTPNEHLHVEMDK